MWVGQLWVLRASNCTNTCVLVNKKHSINIYSMKCTAKSTVKDNCADTEELIETTEGRQQNRVKVDKKAKLVGEKKIFL